MAARLLLVMTSCALVACHGHSNAVKTDGSNPDTSHPPVPPITTVGLKPSLDLSGVVGFAIAGSANAPEAGCAPSTLLALGSDGSATTISVTDGVEMGSGGTTCDTSSRPETASAVFNTPNYVVINYQPALQLDCSSIGSGGGCTTCPFVVARKSDGVLVCGNPSAGSAATALGTIQQVQGDADLLFLLTTAPSVLAQIDMTMKPPTLTIIDNEQQTGDTITAFNVDQTNDVLLAGNFGERVYGSDGSSSDINTIAATDQWIGTDGDFYYLYNNGSSSPNGEVVSQLFPVSYLPTVVGNYPSTGATSGGISLVTPTQNAMQVYAWETNGTSNAIVELMASMADGLCFSSGAQGPAPKGCTYESGCTGTCLNVGGGTFECGGGWYVGSACTSDENCNAVSCSIGGVQHLVSGANIASITNGVGFNNDIYLQATDPTGNGMLLDVPVSSINDTACCTTANCCPFGGCCSSPAPATTLLAAGAYTQTIVSMSSFGDLSFAALRTSDSAHVIGHCARGVCTVLNPSAPAIVALQRID